MRKVLAVGSMVAVAVMTAVATGEAQTGLPVPVSIEARGGFAFPTGEWTDDVDLGTGVGFGVSAIVGVTPMINVYGGWERYSFELDDEGDLEGADVDAVDSGFRLGAEVALPLAAPVSPFVFGGLTYSKLSVSASGGGASVEVDSDNSLGFEVGAGARIPLGTVIAFTPTIRYGSHSAEFDAFSEFGQEDVSVGRVTLDLALRFSF